MSSKTKMKDKIKSNDDEKIDSISNCEVVNGFRSCRDLSDIVPLYLAKELYLKPNAKINVSVNLPQLKTPGKTISTWEVMEKIRFLIRPDEFASLKVTTSSLEFVRLEGDLADRCRLQRVLARLEGQRLNLAGFTSLLKVRAAETKDDFPNKHAWDSFFRDAKHMNELKSGERPDTIHISGLPVKWFSEDGGKTASEKLMKKIFEKWGDVRRVDIPSSDPYRTRMRLGSAIKKCSFGDGIFFDVYVQYHDYIAFVKLMDALRGMKVMKKSGQNFLTAPIKVDFDKTKHMSDSTVSHREFERKRLIAQDNLAAEKLRRKEEAEAQRREQEKKKEAANLQARESRQKKREEKRRRKALTVLRKQEEDKVSMKIAREERKLIKAQRQLESIRLLDELFDRIKIKVEKKEIILGEKKIGESTADEKSLGKSDGTVNKSTDADEKLSDKKEKKSKKKKSKKEKKRQKKDKKHGSSSDSDETDKKKLKSALGVNTLDTPYSGVREANQSLNFPSIYTQFPQPWFYDAAAMMFPGVGRGGGGLPINRYPRGRGRGYSGRRGGRGNQRSIQPFHPHAYNEQYYKYFASLAGVDYYDSEYSRSRSRSRNRSSSRRRTRTRKRRSSSSRSRSKSRRRRRSSSRSRSRSRTRRSRSRRSSHSRSRRSRSRSVKVTRAKSTSATPKRRSRSKSWSLPKSPRDRSCSWSKNVDGASDSKVLNTPPVEQLKK